MTVSIFRPQQTVRERDTNKYDMGSKTADFGRYIENCRYGDYLPTFSGDQVFGRGLTHYRPRLETTQTNRILLYPGSFNPPHHGHLALLSHAFESSRDDINIIAAIILPLDDDCVEEKCRDAGEDVVLTKDQRVRLWRGESGPNDWYWVYDRSMEEWDSFRNRLCRRHHSGRIRPDICRTVRTSPLHGMRGIAMRSLSAMSAGQRT
jgi:hypothetical protein